MLTGSARRAAVFEIVPGSGRRAVASVAELNAAGVTHSVLRANLAARRWRRHGRAVVLHSGPLSTRQKWQVALLNCGKRSALAAFTAAAHFGLQNWERTEVHIIVPDTARPPVDCGVPIRLHRTSKWQLADRPDRCQLLAPALVLAASEFRSPRPACGILAAAVQQGLTSAAALTAVLATATRTRHRAVLLDAVHDIAGGSHALSEIDFVRLCSQAKLAVPERQTFRPDSMGRRRYLDATWRRSDGRLVVVEVDGALHLSPQRWWEDQLRQNELVLGDALVLRFPSVVVRTEPELVVRQLRRALLLGDVPAD